MRFDKVTGPAHWASYFINGDASGLSDEEHSQADAWLEREQVVNVVDCGDPFFTWAMWLYAPELNCSGGDVVEYTAEVIK
jgi:hypothetical protein